MIERKKVSETVWPWRSRMNQESSHSGNRLKSLIIGLIIGGGASLLLLLIVHPTPALVVLLITVSLFAAGSLSVKLHSTIQNYLTRFASLVGRVLTWLLLVPFFYLFFPLGRLAQRLRKRDPLSRELERETASYWEDRQDNRDPPSYMRQY